MKLFQTLTSSVRKEHFLGISSCLNSESSRHSPEPYLWTDQIITNFFLRKVTQGPYKLKWRLEATNSVVLVD